MPLTVQDHNINDIYIVGYSLRLPNSNNAHEFHENLIHKINMVSKDERHPAPGSNNASVYLGQLKQSLDYFDNLFFGIHGKQADKLDPQVRLLLETSFEALVDAAIFPEDIKGSSMGVYTGSCFSDAHNLWMQGVETMTGYEHSGCAGAMAPNRLSYFYDLHGPSFNIDTACSSSLTALNYAINDLAQGKCDTAFVCGTSLILRQALTTGFQKLQMLSPNGFCKTFDALANGYSRADGIVSLVLTRRPDFIRYTPYAKVLAASSNTCGYNENGISYPNHHWQAALYNDVLNRTKTESSEIHYIECHGTGTVVGDNEELLGIKDVFGDRDDLVLGALKSNMGHAEGASGLASMAKVLLSYETKTLYPQLHLQERIPQLGTLRTLSEPEPWRETGKALINSFGFGGSNSCVLVDAVPCQSNTVDKKWHGLHFISSRTKEGLYDLKRELEKSPQQLPVFKDVRYPWREVVGVADDPQLEPVEKRPLYFAFSGNGSQWQGMGVQLMQAYPLFKNVLSQCGKDIPNLLLNGWEGPLAENRLLTALQIALIDLLTSLGIKADGYVAHSAGEVAASYASGATTLKETMAIAQARGRAFEEMPDGLMIAVGLSQEEALLYLNDFDEISIACINSPQNVSLSGNRHQIEALRQRLRKERKVVIKLNTQGKPYHSHLTDRSNVKKHLTQAYQGMTPRNSSWHSAIKDYSPDCFSVDYHIESVVRPVDFLGAMLKIPTNAIIVEIGPHNLLRPFIRGCTPSIQYVSLLTKESNDLDTFKKGLGRLWTLGVDLRIVPDKMRPALSVRAKQTAWKRDYFPAPRDNEKKYKHTFILDLQGKDTYLLGHTIDGRAIFPAMGMVYLFWQCYLESHSDSEVVTVDQFKILRGIPLIGEQIKLEVLITADGLYQLLFNEELIAEATLGQKENSTQTPMASTPLLDGSISSKESTIPKDTIYRLCHNKGYQYANEFQVIDEIYVPNDSANLYAKAQSEHWICLLDGLLHLILLRETSSQMMLPTSIRHIELSKKKSELVSYNSYTQSIQCGEILIQGGEFTPIARKTNEPAVVIFQREDTLCLGLNAPPCDKAEYRKNILAYSVAQFQSIQDKLIEPHHQKIKTILQKYSDVFDIAQLSQCPNSFFYQLIHDAYLQSDEFISAPISWIANHPYYSNIYHNDFGYALEFINKILSVVRQNTAHYKINLFEIGSRTGGFLKQASAFLYPQDIIHCTDLRDNRIIFDESIQRLTINHHQFDLNQEFSTEMRSLIGQADVVAASNSFHVSHNLHDNLTKLYQIMKPGAFLCLIEITSPMMLPLMGMDSEAWNFTDKREFGLWTSIDHWTSLFAATNFKLISYETDPSEVSTTFLIRKPLVKHYTIMDAPDVFFEDGWVNSIKQSAEPIILYSSDAGGMAGFAKTLNREGKHTLSFNAPEPEQFIEEVTSCGLVTNIIRDNKLATICYASISQVDNVPMSNNEAYHLEFSAPGNLDEFKFVKTRRHKGAFCRVEFAALNFRDVMLASGKINQQSYLGFSKQGAGIGLEFSGYLDNRRIMGIGLDAIANFVYTDFFWEVPEGMELAAAATIPVAYLTVYYSFFERAHLNKKQKILIHGGAGAVGQAAIRVALDVGCEIFTTCQQNKRDYLKTLFPQLDDAHIGDSRSTQFEQQIKEHTQGKGVDIILNSLADDKLQASLFCLAQHGTFIEIGKYDLMKNTSIGLKHFLPNTTFCGIDVDQIFTNTSVMKKLSRRLLKGLQRGVVKPLDQTLFKCDQIPEAFRFLGSGNHRGKVVLDMRELAPKHFENRFYTSGTHLLVGGLGGFGMAVAEWLVEHGAEHLILTGRRGITSGEQTLWIQQLKTKYATLKIEVSTTDLIHPKSARAFIKTCPPLTGIYNLAMVLNDTFFDSMTEEKWQETVNCKVLVTYNLDQLTRKHPIKQFVCFSSLAAQGNPGQSNYAFANNYMENICYDRHAAGLPALAIQWGPVENVGFVAKQDASFHAMIKEVFGGSLSINSCLEYFESCLLQQANVVCTVSPCDTRKKDALTGNEDLLTKISRILKIDLTLIPDDSTLISLGLDSLQAVEMQSIISYASNDNVPIAELGKMTVGELKEKFGKKASEHPLTDKSLTRIDGVDISDEVDQVLAIARQHGEELVME